MIKVLTPGALTTIQDLGRPGMAHLGVPRSGAADRPSLRLANRLVGNHESAAALETTLIGPRLRFAAATTIALTGAPADARLVRTAAASTELAMNTPIRVRAGDELELGAAQSGLRTYIAIRGGLETTTVLGSAASDLLTGLGPRPLSAGQQLEVGTPELDYPVVDLAPVATLDPEPTVRIMLGPRADWFTDEAINTLLSTGLEVTASANRIGIRLAGPPLARRLAGELPSEGMVPGAIQVPPNGQPIVLLVDHPTTGGYPVIAVVLEDDLPVLAQLRPGQQLRFSATAIA